MDPTFSRKFIVNTLRQIVKKSGKSLKECFIITKKSYELFISLSDFKITHLEYLLNLYFFPEFKNAMKKLYV